MIIDPSGMEHSGLQNAAMKAKFAAYKAAKIAAPQATDTNGDGQITIQDSPYPAGTAEAKNWFYNSLWPVLKTQVTPEMKKQYGDAVVGAYKGKPLVPGQQGEGQGDFNLLVDRLIITKGFDQQGAESLAGKIRAIKYPPTNT